MWELFLALKECWSTIYFAIFRENGIKNSHEIVLRALQFPGVMVSEHEMKDNESCTFRLYIIYCYAERHRLLNEVEIGW
jgi:hypothetical protein